MGGSHLEFFFPIVLNFRKSCFRLKKMEFQNALMSHFGTFLGEILTGVKQKLNLRKSRYESFATVWEIRVWWMADFQSGSRVLKRCSEHFLIYIYGIQCGFMPKSC